MRRQVHRDSGSKSSSALPLVLGGGVLALVVGVLVLQGGSSPPVAPGAQAAPAAPADDEAIVEQFARERVEPWFQSMRRAHVEITAEQLRAQVERVKPIVREDIHRARLQGRRDAEIKAEFDAKLRDQ